MAESAHVTSIAAIRDFRAAVLAFHDEADQALGAVRQQVLKALDWFEHDRPQFWKLQVRRGFEDVAEARSRLMSCQMKEVAGHRPSCYEEKEALRHAQRRLRKAQEKVELTRRCANQLRHELDELKGRLAPLEGFLAGEVPRMLALLERVCTILEDYAGVRPAADAVDRLAADQDETDAPLASSTPPPETPPKPHRLGER